ncbi:MAG: dihydrofolate reductase family protein [Anaerolineae bacterium]|nr:dihydrofolate reductase family protein [Anaerolineae bacterium]
MTKTQYYTATSLDGFIADAANSLGWLDQFEGVDGSDYEEFIEAVGALAMGSTTYQWLLDHHIRPGTPEQQPWPYSQPAWVFSSRDLPAIDGADIRFVRGDVRPVYGEMVQAAGGKNVWIVGGGDLAGQFYDHGLLDELIITVAPVTLGSGAPLLPRVIASPPLRLLSATAWGKTFVRLHYQVQRPPG